MVYCNCEIFKQTERTESCVFDPYINTSYAIAEAWQSNPIVMISELNIRHLSLIEA